MSGIMSTAGKILVNTSMESINSLTSWPFSISLNANAVVNASTQISRRTTGFMLTS